MWILLSCLIFILGSYSFVARRNKDSKLTGWQLGLDIWITLFPWLWAALALTYTVLALLQDNFGILNSPWPAYGNLVVLVVLMIAYPNILNKLYWSFSKPYELATNAPRKASPSTAFERILEGLILLLVVLTFAAGCLLPPNNWDSMTYHLSRIMFWYQHSSLDFYATANSRQLYQPPFAELVAYTGWLTDGKSDSGLFMVQWLSYVGSLCLTYRLLLQTQLSRTSRLVGLGIMAATPMFILQAASTQNDLLLGFLLLLTLTALLKASPYGWGWLLLAGLTSIMALMTKGTAFLYLPGLILGWLIFNWHSLRLSRMFPILISLVALAVLLYGQQLYRNYELTGHVLGVDAKERQLYANQTHAVGPMVNNVLRNVTMHLGATGINNFMTKAFSNGIMGITGTDVSDPAITFKEQTFGTQGTTHEDTASNLIATLFILTGLCVAVLKRKGLAQLINPKLTGTVLVGSLISFMLFCFVFRWQPWHSRLHLPLFILLTPLCTAIAVQYLDTKKLVWQILLGLAVGTGIWFALKNDRRQLGNPIHWQAHGLAAYFSADNEGMAPEILEITSLLKAQKIDHVGLFMENDSWDYPFLKFATDHQIKVSNVAVGNITSALTDQTNPPAYIILDLEILRDTQAIKPYLIRHGQYFWIIKDDKDRNATALLEAMRNLKPSEPS